MTAIEAYYRIRHADLTGEERNAVDRIKRAFGLLSLREQEGSRTDVITDLGVAIAAELRRVTRPPSAPAETSAGRSASEGDGVDHPAHYTAHPSGIECIQVVEYMTFNLGNAVKYIWRAGHKTEDPAEDLRKAAWYVAREIERVTKGR
jgi:hypothetical protein